MPNFVPDSSVVSNVTPSPNYGDRKGVLSPNMIVLHYTGMADAASAIVRLCTTGTEVSAHYIVLEDGNIVQCVREADRAWHAGASSWGNETDINSASIGIEIVNPGHDLGYTDFPLRQTAAVIALCKGIIIRRDIRMSRPAARRTPARNSRGGCWRIPVSACGSSQRRSCAACRPCWGNPATMFLPCRSCWRASATAFR
jgi:N-acetyl-anhydromuramyl-L-alanine amidase AmpD